MLKSKLFTILIVTGVIAIVGFGVSRMIDHQEGDQVVVYSTHSESMLAMVAEKFEEETGIKVAYINLKGELADRIRAEKANPQSDVMFGAPSSVFIELKSEGLFASYFPSWSDKIDGRFKDKDGYWMGTIQTPVMLFYNRDLLAPEEIPSDWFDLAAPRYQNKLVFRNALSSSARATYSSLLQQFERRGELDQGWQFLQAIDANTKKYFGSGSLLFQAIGRKEAAISFHVLSSIVDNKIKNGLPLEIVNAESGSPVITDGIALVKGAKHPEAAKAFIDFAGSATVQTMLAKTFNRFPTHADSIANAPEWMRETEVKMMDVDWGALSKSQSAWMQKWDSEVKGSAATTE